MTNHNALYILTQAIMNPSRKPQVPNEEFAELTQPQRDRLAFIELRLRFIGEVRRQDLVTRFGIQVAAATRDIALYKEVAPRNSLVRSGRFYVNIS